MDFSLTEDQQLMKDALTRLGSRYGREYWLSCTKSGKGPEELWQELARAGFVGLLIPEEYGGAGLGMSDMELLLDQLAPAGCLHGHPAPDLVAQGATRACCSATVVTVTGSTGRNVSTTSPARSPIIR